jgi:Integrase zinc binding domain
VVLPPKFFPKAFAWVGGSEECDPNSPEWYNCMGIKRGSHHPGYQMVQNMVKKDQQMNQQSQEWLKNWTNTHQLTKLISIWWKDDWIIVAGDNDLKREVIHFFRDTPSTRHPEITNTYNLAKLDFWWPNMKQDMEQYVKMCSLSSEQK